MDNTEDTKAQADKLGTPEVKAKRGRPKHKPTPKLRAQVMLRKAAGWGNDRVADEIGISTPTLELYYPDEISRGWTRKRGEVLDMLFKSAKKGNVTAQRSLKDIIDAATPIDNPSGDSEQAGAETEEKPKAGYVSKKAVAQEQAHTAGVGTEWGSDLQLDGQPRRPN